MFRHVLVNGLAVIWLVPGALQTTTPTDIVAVLLLLTVMVALGLLWTLRRERRRLEFAEYCLSQQANELAEARRTERRVSAAERHLHELSQRVPLVVFAVRRTGSRRHLTFLAGNLRALFGLDREDVLEDDDVLHDWPFQDRIHPEDRLRLQRLLDCTTRHMQTTATLDFRAYGEAGLRWIHLLLVVRHPPGGEEHWVGYFIDTTDINADNESLRAARNAAERASKAKAHFLATMSHEIRTPMNGVIGMLELLGRTTLDIEQRELLGAVEESTGALLQVLNDVLDFSRLESSELKLDDAPFDPRALFDNVVGVASVPMRRKGLRVLMEVDANLAGQLVGDELRLRQILFNLLSNAGKFTEHGSVKVTVRVVGDDGCNQRLHLSVSDTGIGIPVERQNGLFQPFAQAEVSTARDYGGTGLGLSICQRLVELMGGQIDLDSQPGHGTVVTVQLRLPVARREIDGPELLVGRHAVVHLHAPDLAAALGAHLQALGLSIEVVEASVSLRPGMAAELLFVDAGERGSSASIATHVIALDDGPSASASPSVQDDRILLSANPLRWRGLVRACMLALTPASMLMNTASTIATTARVRQARVLVAEDHPVSQILIRRQLKLLGHQCDVVDHGQAALDALREGSYDLLLTDCRMPVMDGFDLAVAWRRYEAQQAPGTHLPIIAMTAHGAEKNTARCREAGVDDCLGKPVRLRSLEEKMAAWLPAVDSQMSDPSQSQRSTSTQAEHENMLLLLVETSHADLDAIERAVEAGDVSVAAEHLHRLLGAWQVFVDHATLADGERLLDALEGSEAAEALPRLPAFVRHMHQIMFDITASTSD